MAISDPSTNQEIMVPITHGNLGPFESLLAATEAAEEHEEGRRLSIFPIYIS